MTAKEAAGDKNVLVHGAAIAQRALGAGLLDEMEIHLVPVLLGEGRRLFEHLGVEQRELERIGVARAKAASPTSATASAVDAGRPARTASRENARAGVESGRGAASYCTRPPMGRSANPFEETTMPQYMLLMYQPSDGVPRDSDGQPPRAPRAGRPSGRGGPASARTWPTPGCSSPTAACRAPTPPPPSGSATARRRSPTAPSPRPRSTSPATS